MMGIMTIEEKMKLVIDLAEEGMKQGELPIASIIYSGNDIIAQAYTTENASGRYLVHAELQALLVMDSLKYSYKVRREMQLFTNLEPCMMCLGAIMHSFVGELYYSIESPTDGGVVWMEKTWADYHTESSFKPPVVYKGILEKESRNLFKRYIDINPSGRLHDWVKTLIG